MIVEVYVAGDLAHRWIEESKMIRQPQRLQAGVSAWIAHSKLPNIYDFQAMAISKALS
jgi:antirestriction protein